jgi:hypothetical protein
VKSAALFCAWWSDPVTGARIGRATRLELREANRLWWKHRDLRKSKSPDVGTILPVELEDVASDELDQLGIDSLGAA